MFRIFLIISVVLGLTACAQLPQVRKQAVPQDQLLYTQTVDKFRLTHQIDLLKQFKERYPDSSWAQRIDTLMRYAVEVEQRKAQQHEDKIKLTAQERELDEQSRKIQQFIEENRQLSEQIEQLKGLLIQLEQRPQ